MNEINTCFIYTTDTLKEKNSCLELSLVIIAISSNCEINVRYALKFVTWQIER